jgi:hypothetical protein
VLPPEPPASRIDPPLPVVVGPLEPVAPPAPVVPVVELVDPVVADDEPDEPVPALVVAELEVVLEVDPVPLVAPVLVLDPVSSHMSTLGSQRAVPCCVHAWNDEAATMTPKPKKLRNRKRGMSFLTA